MTYWNKERKNKKIEIYEKEVPENCSPFEWIRGRFARSIVEDCFSEEFEENPGHKETDKDGKTRFSQYFKINRREMWYWDGNFIFAPEVDVKVYQTGRFVRIYLKYDKDANIPKEDLKRIRDLIKINGLELRVLK